MNNGIQNFYTKYLKRESIKNQFNKHLNVFLTRRKIVFKKNWIWERVTDLKFFKKLKFSVKYPLLSLDTELYSPIKNLVFYDDFNQGILDLISNITKAKHRVWIETYSLDDSPGAEIVLAVMNDAAKRGLNTIICIDSVGSFRLNKKKLYEFKKNGGNVFIWNDLFFNQLGPFVYRNHKKTFICDNVAYIGTGNLDWRSITFNRYDPKLKFLNENCFDSTKLSYCDKIIDNIKTKIYLLQNRNSSRVDFNHVLKLDGDLVDEIADSMVESFKIINEKFDYTKHLNNIDRNSSKFFENDSIVHKDLLGLCIEADGKRNSKKFNYTEVIYRIVASTKRELTIASSYFHPPIFFLDLFNKITSLDTKLHFYLSSKSDVMFDRFATQNLLRKLSKNDNTKIFYVSNQHLHCKTLVSDCLYTLIGSYNFDHLSNRRNKESGILVKSSALSRQVIQSLKSLKKEEYKTDQQSITLKKLAMLFSSNFIYFFSSKFFDGFENKKLIINRFQHRYKISSKFLNLSEKIRQSKIYFLSSYKFY